jgi:fibronectin-binding autotransporter adhesin
MKTFPSRTPSIRSATSVFQRPVTLLTFVAALTLSPSAFAQVDGDWTFNGGGNWSDASKWSSTPSVPGGVGSTVNITNIFIGGTGGHSITIDGVSRTVGTLNLGATSGISHYLNASGGATLIMDNGGAGAVINNLGGGFDEIAAPIVLNDNLTTNASASGASARIKGGITGTGNVTFNVGSGNNAAGTSNISTGGMSGINNSGTITNSGSGAGITALLAIGSNVTDVTQNSAGFLYLNGINAYTGSTIINRGQLRLNGAGSILSSSPLVLGGGTLNSMQTAGSTQAFASTTLNLGFSTVSNGTATNTVALGTITRSTGGLLNISSLTGTTTTANTVDSSGILGTWITTGTNSSLKYATGGAGGAITAYTGGTAATAANLSNVTSATTNYTFDANTTQTGNITGNTLQYTKTTTGGVTWNNGGFGITLNGLMNSGNSTLTQTGTGIIMIGSDRELVILSNNNRAISLASAIVDNSGGASGLTYGGPSAGVLTLGGINTYSGNTTIASGTFTLADGGALTFYIGADGVNNSVNGTGTANFSGSFIFDLSAADLTDGNSWTIVSVGTLLESFTGTFNVQGFTDTDGDNIWTNGGWSFDEAFGVLSYSAVPEPSTYAFFTGAVMLIFTGVRRKLRVRPTA